MTDEEHNRLIAAFMAGSASGYVRAIGGYENLPSEKEADFQRYIKLVEEIDFKLGRADE